MGVQMKIVAIIEMQLEIINISPVIRKQYMKGEEVVLGDEN